MQAEALYTITLTIVLTAVGFYFLLKNVKPFVGIAIGVLLAVITLASYSALSTAVVETHKIYNATTNTTIIKEVYGHNPYASLLFIPAVVAVGLTMYHFGRWLVTAIEKM